jgi:hypothetical protein
MRVSFKSALQEAEDILFLQNELLIVDFEYVLPVL